ATPLDQAGRPRTAQVALQRRHGRLTQPDLATVLPTTPGPRPDPHPGPGRPGPQTRPRGLRPDQASNPVAAPACWLRGNIESPTTARASNLILDPRFQAHPMPEGPEIRRAADRLAEAVVGKRLASIWFAFPALKRFEKSLPGAVVESIMPHGKALLTRFDNGWTLYSHNQLYGVWRVAE